MKFVQRFMCLIGWAVALLALAGQVGVGNFRLYYGPSSYWTECPASGGVAKRERQAPESTIAPSLNTSK